MNDLLTFIAESPSRFHAVDTLGKALTEAGYTRLSESKAWDIAPGGKVEVDTFSGGWHFPARITKKIESLFPNSKVIVIHQFPSQGEMMHVLEQLDCDETVFVTFSDGRRLLRRFGVGTPQVEAKK